MRTELRALPREYSPQPGPYGNDEYDEIGHDEADFDDVSCVHGARVGGEEAGFYPVAKP